MTGKRRVLPVRRKVKQLDWIFSWFVRTTNCALCSESLSLNYNPRDPGKCITLHHTEGSREEDRWDDPVYVAKMVPCHSSCHRSYHLTKRHQEQGKNVDMVSLKSMERNLSKTLRKQGIKS